MKKTLLYFVSALLIVSCYNDKEFYSLQFKRNNVDEVAKKLEAFHALVEKLTPTSHPVDLSGPLLVEIDSGRRGISFGNPVYLNFREIGEWDSIKNHPDYLYHLPEFKDFSQVEKEHFWDLFEFLIKNEINGAYNGGIIPLFPYRQYPFANRHDMFIILEQKYDGLNDNVKDFFLQNHLIIDKKAGLMLVISDKSRFLRYVYGSDADVPEEWNKPTDKVFRGHAQ